MKQQLPQDYEVIKSEPALQVRGVIKMNGVCKSYNSYGELINIDLKECEFYLKESGRVFKNAQLQINN